MHDGSTRRTIETTGRSPWTRLGRLARARSLVVAIPIVAAATALLFQCGIYNTSLLLPATADASSEASVDASGADAGGPTDPCAHARAPAPPTSEDGTQALDFVLGASFLRLLPNGTISFPHPTVPVGLDLDNTCTCPQPESCKPRGVATHCDGDGGTDDTAGAVFQDFATLDSNFTDDKLNGNLRAGSFTLLFRIKAYNGGQNDKQVLFIVYSSKGTIDPDGGSPTPRFDGTDVWTIDPTSLLGGTGVDGGATCEGNDGVCVPIFADTQAYVADGTLVAHLDFPLTLGSSGNEVVIAISGATIFAKLIPDGASYRIDDGQLAGRWSAGGLLTALGPSGDPLVGKNALCNNAILYGNIKSKVCAAADLMASPADDNTGKTCDALSLAVSFSASSAHLGPIFTPPAPTPNPCGPDWKDVCP